MANDIKEISDIVKKCKILLLDVEGTTTSISFVKDKLFPYAEENVKSFLDSQWENDDVKEAVTALRKLALEDKEKSVVGVVPIPGEDASKEDQIEGLVNNVKWQMSSDRKVGALKQLQGLIWKQGYDNGDIKGHVYDDVLPALEQWHSVDGQKIYIYSSGSVQAQKLLFGQSLAGDLLQFIDGHFDTAVGGKQEATSYKAIVEKIGTGPGDILFLTDIMKEAEAARDAGLQVALVSREGNAPLPDDVTGSYAVIHSLAQLTVSNKRKTDPQEEQPAKVPKTDTDNDVKTASEEITETAPEEKKEEPEKMEVEEEVNTETTDDQKKESPAPVAAPKDTIMESEPVESKEKTEKEKETEKMDTNTNEKEENVKTVTETTEPTSKAEPIKESATDSEPPKVTAEKADAPKVESKEEKKPANEVVVENGKSVETTEVSVTKHEETDKVKDDVPKTEVESETVLGKEPVVEETPPVVITEVEEITGEKQDLEMAEIIDDLEPVIEEPSANEAIEELQTVGEVLEKECDEILSKVQDVTNLDNIPIKPLLNPIAEEVMETENTDSNDIVDRILDTELELEMKQSENSGLNTVKQIAEDAKPESVEVPSESKTEAADNIVEEKAKDKVEAEKKSEEVKDSSPPEIQTELPAPVEETQKEVVESKESGDKTNATEVVLPETKENDKEETKTENVVNEVQVNGKATNGETEPTTLNGDANKDEELSSRLSVENGKEVNGSNGDTGKAENGQAEKKAEVEVSEIKVKTVVTEEPHTDPVEQPTEA